MSLGKLGALAHFVAHECGGADAERLNEVLWRVDIASFKAAGMSVSGETWVKRGGGVAPLRMDEALDGLVRDGLLALDPAAPAGVRRFVPLAPPNPRALAGDERRLAASAAGERGEQGLEPILNAAREGEEIPLYAVLAARGGRITPAVLAWANAVVDGAVHS